MTAAGGRYERTHRHSNPERWTNGFARCYGLCEQTSNHVSETRRNSHNSVSRGSAMTVSVLGDEMCIVMTCRHGGGKCGRSECAEFEKMISLWIFENSD